MYLLMRSLDISVFLSLAVVLTGCVETIVMDSGEEDLPVVVNCLLNPNDTTHTLYLSYMKGKSAEEYLPVSDAEVYMECSNIGKWRMEFHHVEGNRWESIGANFVQAYGIYNLFVVIPGRDTIRASTTIPQRYSIQFIRDLDSSDSLTVYCGIDKIQGGVEQNIMTSPVWIVARKEAHSKVESLHSNYPYIVTNHPRADDFNVTGSKFSDLPLEGIFDGWCMQRTWPAYKYMKKTMPDLALHDDFVRIEYLDTTRFHLLAGPLVYPPYMTPHPDHFDFYYVSEEYDRYLRSVYVHNQSLDSSMSYVYSTSNDLYTNIFGGFGIFGSMINEYVWFMRD